MHDRISIDHSDAIAGRYAASAETLQPRKQRLVDDEDIPFTASAGGDGDDAGSGKRNRPCAPHPVWKATRPVLTKVFFLTC